MQSYVSDKRPLLTHIVRPSYLYIGKSHAGKKASLYWNSPQGTKYMATKCTCPVIMTIAAFTPRNFIKYPNFVAPLLKQHAEESLLIVQDYMKMFDVKSKPSCWHVTLVVMTSDAEGTEHNTIIPTARPREDKGSQIFIYLQISSIKRPNSQTWLFLVSSCSCLCPIHWHQVLSREWRGRWGSANRRCSNYIWVINKFMAF